MIKHLFFFTLSLVLISCGNNQKEENQNQKVEQVESELNTNEDAPVLLGKQEFEVLKNAPYDVWFNENYKYEPDLQILDSLKRALESKSMVVFMGTWCKDSQLQVPVLLNVLDKIEYDTSTIPLYTLSEDKDTPNGIEKEYEIEYVPTIIVFENGEEMGRIVEYPLISIEKDLLQIAKGEEYKHAYFVEK